MVFSEAILIMGAIIALVIVIGWQVYASQTKRKVETKKPSERELLEKIYHRLGWVLFWLFLIALGVGNLVD